ncbi:MAG: sensor histidine kinase [Catenisphaera adipataccumulans]|jgi:two-component system sensor histidine kinase CiaH|uniref:sensor histidine kinase n=1 Tax=Catenisphaera adipataccumulans TaxID=700500 RepID=UPI003D8CA598
MDSRAIEKLRRKFVWISMVAIFVAMLFIGIVINLSYYASSRYKIQRSLDLLVNVENYQFEDNNSGQRNPGQVFSGSTQEINRFCIAVYEDGKLKSFRTDSNDSAWIKTMKKRMIKKADNAAGYGRSGDYYYKIEKHGNSTTVVYLNCVSEINNRWRLLYITAGAALIGLVITYFLVQKFSSRMIQPEIENSRRQQRFITNASHELKTPLAVIRANTEVLEMMNGENEWTQSTLKQVDRMNGLIQNLVMIARSQEEEDKTGMHEVDVSKIVADTVQPYQANASQEHKTLTTHIDQDVKLVCSEGKIRQLTTILIDNAIKYCDDSGTIDVALHEEKKGIRLIVSNHYAEGEHVDYSKFFERFYRQDQSHNIDQGGYGIGLSIAQEICRQYHGSIQADWKDGMISFICELR